MKCYICANEEKDAGVVAVRTVCGMGTSTKHTIRREIEVWEGGDLSPSRTLPIRMPGMLCPECSAACMEG